MFGREPRAGSHRQHMPQPFSKGYGLDKVGYESLRTADSYQFGGGWSAKIVYENDDEGEYAEAILTGPGGMEEVIYPGDGRTFEPGELEDEARQLISEYGDSPYEDTYQYNSSHREASREATASHHLAFFDGFDLPEPRHRVAGWDWDDHLNGFIAAEAAREFTCSCGANVPAPGYTDCHCGKRWNAYTINANGSQKMIAREVPVRDGVVMAGRTASRKQASGIPAFQEGDMVIGRGPDMNTHTLREVGSVVEQDGGYFYRLRKLNGSGPGGPRLYAEEHLEGYRINRTSNHRTAASEEADEAARDMETYLPIVQTHTDKNGNYVFEFENRRFIALFRNNYTKEWIVEQRSGGPDGPRLDNARCPDMATAKGRIELFTRGRPLSTI